MTTINDEASPELGLRERKKHQTRIAIHEAAYRLIDAQGLEATTIEQICHEADVSGRTFFNYYPSKAAAALDQRERALDPAAQVVFRAASGGLVPALCEAIGSSAEVGPSHAKVKELVLRRPELMTHLSQMMIAVRGEFVSLAAERAHSPEQAELAVGLVLTALGRVMHEDSEHGVALADQLRKTVRNIIEVAELQLTDPIEKSD
ncbi:TetR/AcrR family transcriptional regulator [Lacisediminihabitans changchengi]|uniref:TetR family transcriptional regulator n=1 Tax=Lacisediminihabitans changchengi TaxID=2787634 RepID=A0A934W308_9MICO|nr:TetR/AcrR family transcriptional regulator [Lacisediminihabitans changchengi]MBK4348453.1 TetR family transcriptional regulator [Lacisediminihabitans changchengi]